MRLNKHNRKPPRGGFPWTGADNENLLAALRMAGLDYVEGAFAYEGGSDLVKAGLGGRRRTSLWITDSTGRSHQLYLKRYTRRSFLQNLCRVVGGFGTASEAYVEFGNILRARDAAVPTMEAVIANQEKGWLLPRRSYLIVSGVPGDALERCADGFLARYAKEEKMLGLFTMKLGQLVAGFHRTGLVHRDLYASHVFLHEKADEFDLYLIDLARAFSPRLRRFRWLVKDLASLKYSMPSQWVRRWWEQFFSVWRRTVGEAAEGRDDLAWARAIDRRVERMRRRDRKAPPEL